ncbi:MAG TPA: ribose-5-phosphate isomerase RpiA [Candidatus Krumholzibacteria bacterium]|nr:ribose-5-phosphate isomerase RpiA [Candidatus Krumholzibacteria bacterium]
MDAKERAARSAVGEVRNGQVLGLGTGSTAMKALHVLAERIRHEGLDVIGVPTSVSTQTEATKLGIPLTTLSEHPEIDLAFDGADQVDAGLAVIKGYGGALLREKIVARCAKRFLVMVDASKLAPSLCIAVPVEVLPFGVGTAKRHLESLGGKVRQRLQSNAPYVSDNGNWILDADFGTIQDPAALAARIDAIPGVMDHGLFVGMVDALHVGEATAARIVQRPSSR